MKIKDYLESLPKNINGIKGLFGKELKVLEKYSENISELKGKKIEIIEEIIVVGNPRYTIMEMISKDISFEQDINPKLINIVGTDLLKSNIKLYSIFLQDDLVIVRCTEDSISLPTTLQKSSDKFKKDLNKLNGRSVFANRILKLIYDKHNGDLDKSIKEAELYFNDLEEYVKNIYELVDSEIPLYAYYRLLKYGSVGLGLEENEYQEIIEKTKDACIYYYN